MNSRLLSLMEEGSCLKEPTCCVLLVAVCILQCSTVTGLQEIRFHTAEYENSPDLRTPLRSHDMSSPEVGQTSKCLLCLPLQCSQSISEGEAVQQWGLLSGTVFPAAHRPKGSRTWKQRSSCGKRFFLTQHHGWSPGKRRNKPHFWLLIDLFVFV